MQSVSANQSAVQAVTITDTLDPQAWNEYVGGHPQGGLYLRAEWEAPYSIYGLQHVRLAAIRDERVVGVVPLVGLKSWLFTNQLASLPWFDTAGVIADDAESQSALINHAVAYAAERGIDTVQLRQTEPIAAASYTRTDKVLMRLPLLPEPGELWDTFSAKVRNQVRKGQKSDLQIERGGRELLPAFYAVYSENMRDLGSPSHHRRFFEQVFDSFEAETKIYLVRRGNEIAGAGWTMANGTRLEIPWASSFNRFNRYCVNHFMYWHILEDACRAGYEWFHFGRSSVDSGTYRFKKQWGATPLQLHWNFMTQAATPADASTPEQNSFGLASRMWQRLPLWLARYLGPHIISKVA